MNFKIYLPLILSICFFQQSECLSKRQAERAWAKSKTNSRPLPKRPTKKSITAAEEKTTELINTINTQIDSFPERLAKYNSLTSYNEITLIDEWNDVQSLEAIIKTSTLTAAQKKELEDRLQLIKGAIARWQTTLATQIINQAKEQIDDEISNALHATADISALTDRLEVIFYNLVIRFAYGACITLSHDIESAQKMRTSGEQNLLQHKDIFPAEFAQLQERVERLNLALFYVYTGAYTLMTQTTGAQHIAAHQLALKSLNLMNTLEDIYAQEYVKNKKRLLGKERIAEEKRELQQQKALPEIPKTTIPQAPPLPTESKTPPPIPSRESRPSLTPPPAPPIPTEQTPHITEGTIPVAPPIPSQEEMETKKPTGETPVVTRGDITAQELLNAKNKLTKEVTDVAQETEQIAKDISRGDITAQELLEAKNKLTKTSTDITNARIPEEDKNSLQSTLEDALANIRRVVEVEDEDDDDWEEWEEE